MAVAAADKIVRGADLQQVGSQIKSALAGKQDTLVSGTTIKTVNNVSLLGGGNIPIEGVGISTVTSAQDGTIVITLTNGDEITVDLNHVHPQYEKTENKVTSLSASSTDTQYPSAKCVYDLVGDIETLLAAL